jgi:hypothetical protein
MSITYKHVRRISNNDGRALDVPRDIDVRLAVVLSKREEIPRVTKDT